MTKHRIYSFSFAKVYPLYVAQSDQGRGVRRPRRGYRGPTMQAIRYLDKIIDELAQGKALDKIMRSK